MIKFRNLYNRNEVQKILDKFSIQERTNQWIPITYQLLASIMVVFFNLTLKSLSHVPANQVLIVKQIFSLILLFPFQQGRARAFYPTNTKILITLLLAAFQGSVCSIIWIISLKLTSLSEAMVLANTMPIWTMFMAAFILQTERLTMKNIMNFIFSLIGILLIIRPHILYKYFSQDQIIEEENDLIHLLGAFLSILTAITTSGTQVTLSCLNGKIDQIVILTYFSFVYIIVPSLCQMYTSSQPLIQLSMADWCMLFLCGISGVTYQFFSIKAFTVGNLIQMSLVQQSQILFGFIFDIFIYHTEISTLSLIGSIILSVSLIQGILSKQN